MGRLYGVLNRWHLADGILTNVLQSLVYRDSYVTKGKG